jgi:hypothetical protein
MMGLNGATVVLRGLFAEMFGEVRHKLLPLMVDVFGNYGEQCLGHLIALHQVLA